MINFQIINPNNYSALKEQPPLQLLVSYRSLKREFTRDASVEQCAEVFRTSDAGIRANRITRYKNDVR